MSDIEFIERNCKSFAVMYDGIVYTIDLITLDGENLQMVHKYLQIAFSRIRNEIEVRNNNNGE